MAALEATCQSCHQPLLLDSSIANLTPSSYSLIAGSLPTSHPTSATSSNGLSSYPTASREAAEIWNRQNKHVLTNVAESFILLGDSVYSKSNTITNINTPATANQSSHTIPLRPPALPNHELAANLHNLISSNTNVSHPLCIECIGILQTKLQAELDGLSKERDAYIAFEQGMSKRQREVQGARRDRVERTEEGDGLGEYDIEGTDDEWRALNKRKKELEEEEARLLVELKAKEKELEGVKLEEEAVLADEAAVKREEEEFLRNHFHLSTQLHHLSDELESAKMHLLASTSLLAHLESTNVYNDAFQIGYTPLNPNERAYVGTINGLRLGGRPTVEWDEINAAWGHVALCVDRIAARVGFVFDRYRILPLGSASRIDELPPSKQSYELYYSSEMSGFLHNRRFSHGLIALLDCIRQLVEYGSKSSRGWPVGSVDIRKDRISGYSIRLPGLASNIPLPAMSIMGLGGSVLADTSNPAAPGNTTGKGKGRDTTDLSGEEQWTKACLAVLKVLKQVLIAESEADKAPGS